MNLGSKIIGLVLVIGFWVFILGVFFTFGIGAYTLWSMATNQPSFIIKQAPEPNSVPIPVRYAPQVTYLVPRHNDSPATTIIRTPEDARLSVTGIGEVFDLRLIKQSDGQIVYLKKFIFDKPVVRGAIFCLFGAENSTGLCAGIPENDWQEGDYIFDVVASYPGAAVTVIAVFCTSIAGKVDDPLPFAFSRTGFFYPKLQKHPAALTPIYPILHTIYQSLDLVISSQ